MRTFIATVTGITLAASTVLLSAPPVYSQAVSAERYDDMGGGWGGARATLSRNGLLVIDGRAVSNSRHRGTRTRVFVIGYDGQQNALFVSNVLDIPTACGTWDTCPDDRKRALQQQIHPAVAEYTRQLQLVIEDRSGPSVWQNATRNLTEACTSYDDLPVAVRVGIAYQTGFPGCNPTRL